MKKLIIIGGGIAGLAAGIYGKKAGYDVTIYEKNHVAGGECMGWNRNGHHIDNCIHWLTGTKEGTSLRKVWEDVGALDSNTMLAETEAFYTSCHNGQEVTLWNDLDRTEKELLLFSPEDTDEIKKFIEHVRYAESCQMPSDKPMDMMKVKDYIEMGKSMANMPKVMKEYGKINLEDLSARFQHPALQKLFIDYLPKEYIASSFIVSYATITCGNGGIPAKGSLAMANRMVDKFKSLGGNLYCNTSVEKILIKNKKAYGILLDNQKEVLADYIISAADTNVLFNNLIGNQYLNKRWEEVYQNSDRYPLISGFQIACSIDLSAYHKKDTIFFDCEPFMIGNQSVSRMSVKSFEYEPDFAPSGKTVLQANVVQYDSDYLYWE
uniref:phytoene desaturase family protein n=1 Tax=Anaerosporobacter sp. TaxID=1872529 RepID=UPI00286ECB6F